MRRFLFLLNAVLTLPFGVLGLLMPSALFLPFGIVLDADGELIARGYAATLIGYGAIYLVLRNTTDDSVARTLLLVAFVFNSIEAVIQVAGALGGTAESMIWGTVVVHAATAVLCAGTLVRERRVPSY